MKAVELYARVRHACHVEGLSQREAARRFGIDPKTVAKMLRHAVPPGYRRSKPPARPKLDGFTATIDQIVLADRSAPSKQRHTAKRIFERLRAEHSFAGSYTIVKDYLRERHARTQEMFVPLAHPLGHAQVDFGEAVAVIGGVRQKIHFFCLDLPHSDAGFVKAYPAERIEAFLDGHNAAFAFLGGAPQSILYDNTKLAVGRFLGDGKRQRTRAFAELQSHYLFLDRFGRPGKGNDKGKVEGLVGYARRSFLVPIPAFASFAELNAHLEQRCLDRLEHRVRGHAEAIGERLARDLAALQVRPSVPYEPANAGQGGSPRFRWCATSATTIRCRPPKAIARCWCAATSTRWSSPAVPRSSPGTRAAMPARTSSSIPCIVWRCSSTGSARSTRPQALQGWDLPEAFATLHRLLEARMGKAGKRDYVQMLRRLESFRLEDVHAAVREALRLGAIGYDAVKHLVLCRIERRPPKLDLTTYLYLPRVAVAATSASSYLALLGSAA